MSELVEFLRARLDDDEERARFVQREQGDRPQYEPEPWRLSWHDEYDLLCIEPSRALAEVDAKRRIIDQHPLLPAAEQLTGRPTYGCETCHEHADYGIAPEGECETLKLLALPYAGHKDYREEWRP